MFYGTKYAAIQMKKQGKGGVIFLIENEFTTGLSLVIDGGYTAQQFDRKPVNNML